VGRDDISIDVPPRWRRSADPDLGIVVAARAPVTPASGFAPNLVLDAEPVDGSFDRWQESAATELSSIVEEYGEEDSDAYLLGDEQVRYRRMSFRTGEHEVVSEQWCWLIQGVGFTLTGTVAREDYADYTDLFEDVAGTFSVRRQAPG
jgi:hypothetical protein